jgi:hypothetical protein
VDQLIAALGQSGWVALPVAVLLGLRHAADPDHLFAVSTLVATDRERGARRATSLGLTWGLGHATTLLLVGVPFVLYGTQLPPTLQRAAEIAVGVVIVALALRLLRFSFGGEGQAPVRPPRQAFGVGLLHGVGGSAAVGLLLLATISSRPLALVAFALFAGGTALSMVSIASCLGRSLARWGGAERVAPALAVVSIAFGTSYALGAL